MYTYSVDKSRMECDLYQFDDSHSKHISVRHYYIMGVG